MNKKDPCPILYFDCFSGVSGDMFLGALLDLGFSEQRFKETLTKIPIENVEVVIQKTKRHHIVCTDVQFHFSGQPLRHLTDITAIIHQSTFSKWIKEQSVTVMNKIAQAEASVHDTSIDQIHFHEIGAVDTILDVMGTFFLLQELGMPFCCSSPLNLGSGWVKTEHGNLPIPAPATVELLKEVPVYASEIRNELVTPTGAALIATIAQQFGPLPEMSISAIGYGAGDTVMEEIPNFLRILKGTSRTTKQIDDLFLMECNIDDMNPENYQYVMDKLFGAGARDVTLTPLIMKKNRPGIMLSVLIDPEYQELIENTLFRETTTLGVRKSSIQRRSLDRKFIEVMVRKRKIPVKVAYLADQPYHFHPEYEPCAQLAHETGIPLQSIQEEAIWQARSKLQGNNSIS